MFQFSQWLSGTFLASINIYSVTLQLRTDTNVGPYKIFWMILTENGSARQLIVNVSHIELNKKTIERFRLLYYRSQADVTYTQVIPVHSKKAYAKRWIIPPSISKVMFFGGRRQKSQWPPLAEIMNLKKYDHLLNVLLFCWIILKVFERMKSSYPIKNIHFLVHLAAPCSLLTGTTTPIAPPPAAPLVLCIVITMKRFSPSKK